MDEPVNLDVQTARLEERAFELISGHRALDLLATLRDRHRSPVECLREPADLDRWLAVAGFELDVASRVADVHAARTLREAINAVARAFLAGIEPPGAALVELNRFAAQRPLTPQLTGDLRRRWNGAQQVRAAISAIAREAVDLFAGPERALIRECAGAPDCSRLYLDRSRAQRRRWCHMEWCGSRAKMAAYRQRRAE